MRYFLDPARNVATYFCHPVLMFLVIFLYTLSNCAPVFFGIQVSDYSTGPVSFVSNFNSFLFFQVKSQYFLTVEVLSQRLSDATVANL